MQSVVKASFVCQTLNRKREYLTIIIAIIAWVIMPVPVMLLLVLSPLKYITFYRHKTFLFTIISLTFGLLAFTQTSISDTDISRYYAMFGPFMNSDLHSLSLSDSFVDNLYYVFNPVTIAIVAVFKNVQYLSLFWVSIIYFFYFLSCSAYCKFRKIRLNPTHFTFFLLISILGFILFTQVTETIKQAAAISVFFYGFTAYLNNNRLKAAIFTVLSIGIHSSPLLLLPLFFYRQIKRVWLITFFLICLIFSFVNIMEIVVSVVPEVGILMLINEKVSQYLDPNASTASSLLRYDFLMVFLFSQYLVLKCFSSFRNVRAINIILIYICLVITNRFMVQNYCRFVNMSYVIYGFAFIEIICTRFSIKNFRNLYLTILIIGYLITNLHMTYYRTIGGQYLSHYFDNNLLKIILSPVPMYLSFEYS